MKILLTSFLLFCSLTMISQTDKDLYITYKPESNFVVFSKIRDSSESKIYRINFLTCPPMKTMQVLKNGRLQITTKIGRGIGNGGFIYDNFNNGNDPLIVRKTDIINVISFEVLSNEIDSQNFWEVTAQFSNIFIINEKEEFGNFFIARKVKRGP